MRQREANLVLRFSKMPKVVHLGNAIRIVRLAGVTDIDGRSVLCDSRRSSL